MSSAAGHQQELPTDQWCAWPGQAAWWGTAWRSNRAVHPWSSTHHPHSQLQNWWRMSPPLLAPTMIPISWHHCLSTLHRDHHLVISMSIHHSWFQWWCPNVGYHLCRDYGPPSTKNPGLSKVLSLKALGRLEYSLVGLTHCKALHLISAFSLH